MNLPITESQENQTNQPAIALVQRQPNNNLLLWVILSITVLSLAGNAYFFFAKNPQSTLQNTTPLVDETLPVEPEASTTPQSTPTTKEKLATVLARECNDQSINFSVLPFTISSDLVKKYTMEGITCEEGAGSKTERYLAFNITENDAETSSYMFIYHPQSAYDGFMDPLTDDTTAVSISVGGKQYSLTILEPGPYGISEQAVIVQLSAKKTDEMSVSTAKAFASHNFQDNQTMQLVKKYGSKPADVPDDFPVTVDNKEGFKKDFITYIQTEGTEANKELKRLAATIDSDLLGISF